MTFRHRTLDKVVTRVDLFVNLLSHLLSISPSLSSSFNFPVPSFIPLLSIQPQNNHVPCHPSFPLPSLAILRLSPTPPLDPSFLLLPRLQHLQLRASLPSSRTPVYRTWQNVVIIIPTRIRTDDLPCWLWTCILTRRIAFGASIYMTALP